MRTVDIRDLESKAGEFGYTVTVKVNVVGETLVTLKSKREGHVFEGKAPRTSSDGYGRALEVAVTRMVGYERRFER